MVQRRLLPPVISIDNDIRGSDYLAPALEIHVQLRGELRGRVANDLCAKVVESGPDFAHSQASPIARCRRLTSGVGLPAGTITPSQPAMSKFRMPLS